MACFKNRWTRSTWTKYERLIKDWGIIHSQFELYFPRHHYDIFLTVFVDYWFRSIYNSFVHKSTTCCCRYYYFDCLRNCIAEVWPCRHNSKWKENFFHLTKQRRKVYGISASSFPFLLLSVAKEKKKERKLGKSSKKSEIYIWKLSIRFRRALAEIDKGLK